MYTGGKSDVSLCHAVSDACTGRCAAGSAFSGLWICTGVYVPDFGDMVIFKDTRSVYSIYIKTASVSFGSEQ